MEILGLIVTILGVIIAWLTYIESKDKKNNNVNINVNSDDEELKKKINSILESTFYEKKVEEKEKNINTNKVNRILSRIDNFDTYFCYSKRIAFFVTILLFFSFYAGNSDIIQSAISSFIFYFILAFLIIAPVKNLFRYSIKRSIKNNDLNKWELSYVLDEVNSVNWCEPDFRNIIDHIVYDVVTKG